MGIYDRDYNRDDYAQGAPGFHLGSTWTWTTKLVIFLFAIYLVQVLTRPGDPKQSTGWFTNLFALYANLPRQPWMAFQLVTYGFLHDPWDIKHILFNAFSLWMFGRFLEQRLGKKEFLTFFLVAVAFSGAFWVVSEWVANGQLERFSLVGASGGIAAVLLLFCLSFPRQQILIWAVLPMPAWVFALVFLALNLFGAAGGDGHVAYTAHIGGALFGFLYYQRGGRLERWLPSGSWWPRLGRRANLRVHHPDPVEPEEETDDQVDDILRKIREHGQDSLTWRERRVLEKASREYQKKRR